MPRRELRYPQQVEDWLHELAAQLAAPANLTLVGSGALLWHAAQRGLSEPLPENSMDVDPITNSEEVARHCYEAVIGSDFERTHGWHVNLMPEWVLKEFPAEWSSRAMTKSYGFLTVTVPTVADVLLPKRKRNEPRDRAHDAWATKLGLLN